jgi:hypothetical protein
MLCHAEERAMLAYQFGYLDELRGFGDRPVWINPLWFWEHQDAPPARRRLTGRPRPGFAGTSA